MVKRVAVSFIVCGVLAVITASCSGYKDKPAVSPAPDKTSTHEFRSPSTVKPQLPEYVWPLTGIKAAAVSTNRPFMVMVNNAPQARPQSGLSYADVLYEILAEGEITRLVAVYQSKHWDGPIGPVRSIRPYYIDLGKMIDAVPVHAGGSPDAYAELSEQKLEHMDEITNAGPFFWRDANRKAPHNLYTNLEHLEAGTRKLGIRESSRNLRAQPVFVTEMVEAHENRLTRINVTFLLDSYVVSYQYDPESRLYKRFINGAPHLDLSNNEQLSATNVVVIGAEHITLDAEGRRNIGLIGSGKGYLFQRDKVQSVRWERADKQDIFHYYQENREIAYYPGTTHVLVVPNNPTFEGHIQIIGHKKN
ncbi:Protein of unknown function [Paenibacillus sp. 1_12]|uniref:DUF3048 domain-containing protein n=1 Tax=Paenibacillus sp. 1_12 TaxID=1566278 RepID=UPI0008E318FC|nr:DUF3048 domain-containing protein [Paenibacillus sp. 1_12]SFM06782.1 Protein of unknown function [Paenibacillus sp. 1_12]